MIKMSEFAKRRKILMEKMDSNEIVIIPSANEIPRNNDADYPFRQNSDFYYLTGFDEPEAILVLLPKRKEGEYILFNRVRDRSMEIWNGPRAGQAGAVKEFGADQAFPIDEFEKIITQLLVNKKVLHSTWGRSKKFEYLIGTIIKQIRSHVRAGEHAPTVFVEVTARLHEMRVCKSPSEIALIQKAIDISHEAHRRAMTSCKPGMYEYQLEAELIYTFIKNGARSPAYTSIVGTGPNSCILHYMKNDCVISKGDLVLIDAGAEYQNYASDITRTFPANGRFSEPQRLIYELVLEAQLTAISAIKPGISWNKTQEIAIDVITQGLIDLGLLKGKRAELIEKNAYFSFYMHRAGHFMGLDVHDVGEYKKGNNWRSLEPGMVFTVEPGIYISADSKGVDKKWHNIGVRIEDDVLVTEKGCEVLSQKIPKKIADIEAIMAK